MKTLGLCTLVSRLPHRFLLFVGKEVAVLFQAHGINSKFSTLCRSSLCDGKFLRNDEIESPFLSCTYLVIISVGGVIVTASHLPADRNGFKFFTVEGPCPKR